MIKNNKTNKSTEKMAEYKVTWAINQADRVSEYHGTVEVPATNGTQISIDPAKVAELMNDSDDLITKFSSLRK